MRSNHISVCLCTFQRPELLLRSLRGLREQATEGRFSYSIVVADNDGAQSACPFVTEFARDSGLEVHYCVEARQNIALARNTALAQADGEYLAFLDDDEVPGTDWLLQLYGAIERLSTDGVLGPVEPYFDFEPPDWATKGKFFDRPRHPTGYRLRGAECRTGNVLLRRRILPSDEPPFRAEFATGGEDVDFFHRMIERGAAFGWCGEAPVFELVPPHRCRRRFLLRRALLRGSNFPKYSTHRAKHVVKSLVAVPLYACALPALALCGEHLFLKYLIKLCDHAARLMALAGFVVATERET